MNVSSIFSKKLTFFLSLLLLSSLFAQTNRINSSHNIRGKNSHQFSNPFLNQEIEEVHSLNSFKLNQTWGGYLSHPQTLQASFSLLSRTGSVLKYVNSEKINIYLTRKNQQYPVLHKTKWQRQRYQSKWFLPKVPYAGAYNIKIEIKKKKTPPLIFNLQPKISYQDRKINLIFLIDNSGSMQKNDPSRSRFKAIEKVINHLRWRNKINRIGVIQFAEKAHILSPMVKVKQFSVKNFKQFETYGQTDFTKAFKEVDNLIKQGNLKAKKSLGKTALLFLTDGQNSFPYADEHIKIIRQGIPIFTIGLSQKKGNQSTDYNPKFLKRVAEESGGTFSQTDDRAMADVYQKIVEKSITQDEKVLIYPLKKTYLENELVVVRYSSLGNQLKQQIRVSLSEHFPKSSQSPPPQAEVLYHQTNSQGGTVGIFHAKSFLSSSPNEKEIQQKHFLLFSITLHFYLGKALLKQHRIFYQIAKPSKRQGFIPPIAPTTPLIFKNLPFGSTNPDKNSKSSSSPKILNTEKYSSYEVRYFDLQNQLNKKINFISLSYLPLDKHSQRNLDNNLNNNIYFMELPFSISPRNRTGQDGIHRQAVVFQFKKPPSFSPTSHEGYLIIHSPFGAFLNNFTYSLSENKSLFNQSQYPQRTQRIEDSTFSQLAEKQRWFTWLVWLTGLFFVGGVGFGMYWVVKRKGREI